MNYPAAELRGVKMSFYLINPDAEHRGILLIKLLFTIQDVTPFLWVSFNLPYSTLQFHLRKSL